MKNAIKTLIIFMLALPCTWTMAGSLSISVSPGEFTFEKALQEARLRRLHGEDGTPVLQLQPGTYRLSQPIILRPEDHHTTIIGDKGAVLSGGVRITGWRRHVRGRS